MAKSCHLLAFGAVALLVCPSLRAATHHQKSRKTMPRQVKPLVTREIRLVDSSGKTRILLSTRADVPSIQLLQPNGVVGLSAILDEAGRGSVSIHNPDATGPSVALEIDDKGSHVKFDRPGGASAYLFLNNSGQSGIVFLDALGKRRFNIQVHTNGDVIVQRLDDNGDPIP